MEAERQEPKYDRAILDKWLDGGLCHGAGDGKNTVCLEQAVALCAGLPLTDQPDSCVAKTVSAFGRRLNDRRWSSDKARAAGLREFAFAQLGTAGALDERKWVKRVAELVIREVLPAVFRKVAALPKLAGHRVALEAAALKCEQEGTEASAREASETADAAYAAYAADADADAASAYAAADAAYAAAYAAADAAYAADAYAASAYAAADAAYAADARSRARDEMLTMVANIGARAIREQLPQ